MQQMFEPLARRVADVVATIPGVVGVTLGGSVAAGLADERSDLDLHVYWREPLAPPDERARQLAHVADENSIVVNILTWGLEDHLRIHGQLVELVYVQLDDLQVEIERAYHEGLISEGFTTARLYYLVHSVVLADLEGEIEALRKQLQASYPEPTRQLLLRYQPDILRYELANLRKGQYRNDLLFVQHRRYSIQMIFFNLLFALNREYHPGEKRLLKHAERCAIQPADLSGRWNMIARLPADDPELAGMLEALTAELLQLVEAE